MKALKLAAITCFHPIVGFNYMKKDRDSGKRYNYLPVVVILLLMVLVKIFSMYVTHYPLNSVNVRNANVFSECMVMVVPIVTWAVASYASTTIMGGEVLFRECLTACCYSLVPYIVISIPMIVISNILDQNAAQYYNVIFGAALFYVLLLLFINLKEMNHYTIFKTIGVIVLSLLTMILIWAVIALVGALTMRFISFLSEVIREIRYKI